LRDVRISKRLAIQTLLNSLTDGFDQLPDIAACFKSYLGKWPALRAEEMDVIHLAKVGGLAPALLNATDKALFKEWFSALP
jgi:hypothetical protein